ncbi:MAG: DUF4386 family protein [Chloroflexota bacterium]|nr:DUF4386 family protein [Chloroflexota bacterium]
MERPPTTQTSHIPNSNRQQVLSHRMSERITAVLLILYSIAQVITIVTRIASGTDQPDALSSIAMISANHSWYIASKIANMIAAFLLLAASALIFQVFRPFDRTLALLAAVLLGTAGIFWLHSSLAGMALAEVSGAPLPETALLPENVQQSAFFAIEPVRAVAGRVGFTAAALALAAWSALIVFAGPLPRWLGWAGWATAVAMLFIWDPAAAAMHRLGGGALLIWLLVVAGLLAWKGTAYSIPSEKIP